MALHHRLNNNKRKRNSWCDYEIKRSIASENKSYLVKLNRPAVNSKPSGQKSKITAVKECSFIETWVPGSTKHTPPQQLFWIFARGE